VRRPDPLAHDHDLDLAPFRYSPNLKLGTLRFLTPDPRLLLRGARFNVSTSGQIAPFLHHFCTVFHFNFLTWIPAFVTFALQSFNFLASREDF